MNGQPRRIQYRRGQTKPPGAKIVTRASRYGNPFDWRTYGAAEAVRRHAEWIINPASGPIACGARVFHPTTRERLQADLSGWDLGCACDPGAPCHGDTLLRLANP